jgi:hypothetical protein
VADTHASRSQQSVSHFVSRLKFLDNDSVLSQISNTDGADGLGKRWVKSLSDGRDPLCTHVGDLLVQHLKREPYALG